MKKCLVLLLILVMAIEGMGQRKVHKAEQLVHSLVGAYLQAEGRPPGISVAMLKNGKIMYAEGFGYADVAAQKRVTTSTQFRAASVSKMMTATALGKLMQDNKVELDQPVQKYVPQFPEKAYSITPRLLAGHLAGMPHYSFTDRVEKRTYATVSEALSVFSHQKLLHQPGTRYTYSTHGYTLLSAVVEGASGKPFLTYMKQDIFQPLGMNSTGPDLPDGPMENKSGLYKISRTGTVSILPNPENTSYKWGAGGMVSTPSDLVRLGDAYLNGFLQPELVREMFQSQKLSSGAETGVGIGWRGSWDLDGRRVFEHAGSMDGARSVVVLYPSEKFAVSIMTNAQAPNRIEEMAHVLAAPFLNRVSSIKQPRGQGQGTLMLHKTGGTRARKATLILDGSDDRLIVEEEKGTLQTYRMMYLQSGSRYAIITADGILWAEFFLDKHSKKMIGKVVSYGSPQLVPPSSEKALLVFEGGFSRH